MKKGLLAAFMLSTSAFALSAVDDIGIFMIYDSSSNVSIAQQRMAFGDGEIGYANNALKDSGVSFQVRVVGEATLNLHYSDGCNNWGFNCDYNAVGRAITRAAEDAPAFNINGVKLSEHLDRIGADYAVIITDTNELCGRAESIPKSRNSISSANIAGVASNCENGTLAHEIGHLWGLAHGEAVALAYSNSAHSRGIDRDSMGHAKFNFYTANSNGSDEVKEHGEFGTVMIHNYVSLFTRFTAFNGNNYHLPIFSNPNKQVLVDDNLWPAGRLNRANAARTLNAYANDYRNIEHVDVNYINFADSNLKNCASRDGRESNQRLAFTCADAGVSSLDGVEYMTGAYDLDFSGNNIRHAWNLTKMDTTTNRNLNLYGNNQFSCANLRKLESMNNWSVLTPEKCFEEAILIPIIGLALY